MGASHTLADFRLLLAEHTCEVFLFKPLFLQYAVNPVHYEERQVNTPTDFGRNISPVSLYFFVQVDKTPSYKKC